MCDKEIVSWRVGKSIKFSRLAGQIAHVDLWAGATCAACGRSLGIALHTKDGRDFDLCFHCQTCNEILPVYGKVEE